MPSRLTSLGARTYLTQDEHRGGIPLWFVTNAIKQLRRKDRKFAQGARKS